MMFILRRIQAPGIAAAQRKLTHQPMSMLSNAASVSHRLGGPALSRSISVQSILHGSPVAREIESEQQSRIVARGKHVYAFETHHVKPERGEIYKKAAEKYYVGLVSDSGLDVKHIGSWGTLVGQLDTYIHILAYENYAEYDRSLKLLRESEQSKLYGDMLPHMITRSTQLNSEFAFLPPSQPQNSEGIYELRTYRLQPGTLLQWEHVWRLGIQARKKFVTPVGAWFSQIGRLHEVHHLWQYSDLETRAELRKKAWQLEGWSDTVHKTAELAKFMDSSILYALPFSPRS